MRILLLLRDTSPNGITTYNRVLARELQAQGHEVFVWPSDAGFGSGRPLKWLPSAHPLMEPLLHRWLCRLKPDAVYAHGYTQARFAHALKARTGIRWFACMHNGHGAQRMAQWRRLFANADGVVTMCETLHHAYEELITAGDAGGERPPVLLSRLPIVLPPLTPRRPAGSAPLTLGYCSRLSSQKGQRCEAWLEGVARLARGPRACRALVIGGGSHLQRIKSRAAKLRLDVEFTGAVADPGPWLERVDVITGAGYALMEGLLRGSAAVGLGFGGCIGAVTPQRLRQAYAYNFGDHCPHPQPSDPDTIAAALQEAIALLGTPALAEVHAHSQKHFEPASIVRELVGFMSHPAHSDRSARRGP